MNLNYAYVYCTAMKLSLSLVVTSFVTSGQGTYSALNSFSSEMRDCSRVSATQANSASDPKRNEK